MSRFVESEYVLRCSCRTKLWRLWY